MKKLIKWVRSLGHGLKNQIDKIKKRREDLLKRQEEARQQRDRIRKTLNNMKRHPNETTKEWQRRKENKKKFLENEQKNVELLAKKTKYLHDKIDDKAKKLADKKDSGFDPKGGGIVTFDGKPCVEWIAYWLQKSRNAGWGGTLVSGYRTPEYSQQLCYQICGAPSCPGRCAGTSSNHTKQGYLGGAVDVSDYTNFEAIQYRIGSPLRNDLPVDPVHFSATGH